MSSELTADEILAIVRGLPAEAVAEIFLKSIAGSRPAAGIKVECNIGWMVDVHFTAFDGHVNVQVRKCFRYDIKYSDFASRRESMRDLVSHAVRGAGVLSPDTFSVNIGGLENAAEAAADWLTEIILSGDTGKFERTFPR